MKLVFIALLCSLFSVYNGLLFPNPKRSTASPSATSQLPPSLRHPASSLFFGPSLFPREQRRVEQKNVVKVIKSEDDLFSFLAADSVPAVLVFHASWCKVSEWPPEVIRR